MAKSTPPARARRFALLLGGLLLTTGAGSATAVVNTGEDASSLPFVACANRVGFRTAEARQGATDLTGDGDAFDATFQVLDLGTGTVTNVGVDAGGPLACGGSRFAFGVLEPSQGSTDLNGDGDAFDAVLHVYDAATATLTNVGLAVSAVEASADLVAFTVGEASQGGVDRNGDGDVLDQVLHVLDPTTGIVTNVGQEAGDADNIRVVGRRIAFLTDEGAQGSTDLNGDGAPDDVVVQVYDAATATLVNVMRPATPSPGIQFDGAVVGFLVSEAAHGPASLNADPDTGDLVLHLYCLDAPPCAVTGLVNVGVDATGGFTLEGDLVALRTLERNEPGGSLNPPDSDTRDRVVQLYRLGTGVLTNTGLAGQPQVRIVGNRVAIGVRERLQDRTDLNGDGDSRDVVLHVHDATSATTVNTGQALWARSCRREVHSPSPRAPCLTAGADTLLFTVAERSQGKTDLNGDLDFRDAVVRAWTLSTGTLASTGLAGEQKSTLLMAGALGAFRVSEKSQAYSDLNGDGDRKDRTIAVFDAGTGIATELGTEAGALFLVEGTSVVIRTSEENESVDLNGDGDLQDAVLQYHTVP
jgi:hypothetical protein